MAMPVQQGCTLMSFTPALIDASQGATHDLMCAGWRRAIKAGGLLYLRIRCTGAGQIFPQCLLLPAAVGVPVCSSSILLDLTNALFAAGASQSSICPGYMMTGTMTIGLLRVAFPHLPSLGRTGWNSPRWNGDVSTGIGPLTGLLYGPLTRPRRDGCDRHAFSGLL